MSALYAVLAFVLVERCSELVYARRNTLALLARGAREVAPEQYPWFILLHAGWLAAMLFFIPRGTPPNVLLLAAFFVLQVGRAWVLMTLGPYWTTRIITLPYAPLVQRGPYRFVRHPNYLVVALEIALLPLAFGAWPIALSFTIANTLLLALRIRAEDRALATRVTVPAESR